MEIHEATVELSRVDPIKRPCCCKNACRRRRRVQADSLFYPVKSVQS